MAATLEAHMLTGRNALVTGSTSGIGRGIAEALAEHGANVMLHGLGDPDEIAACCTALLSIPPAPSLPSPPFP
jgi:3-hydroxybutyrate dehydrogenase